MCTRNTNLSGLLRLRKRGHRLLTAYKVVDGKGNSLMHARKWKVGENRATFQKTTGWDGSRVRPTKAYVPADEQVSSGAFHFFMRKADARKYAATPGRPRMILPVQVYADEIVALSRIGEGGMRKGPEGCAVRVFVKPSKARGGGKGLPLIKVKTKSYAY